MITDLALKGGMCVNGVIASFLDSCIILEMSFSAIKTASTLPYLGTADMLYVNAANLASSEATGCYAGTAFLSSAVLLHSGAPLAAAEIFAVQFIVMPIIYNKVHDYFNPNYELVNSTIVAAEAVE
jgi:hypothetical protein